MTTNQPSAHIALNNNRLRSYADVIYLKDGDEFQIELFNPLQVSVLAKVWINNRLISNSGLVIKPGQRYFLDRHIDQNAKFKFSTYTVDPGQTPEVLESIKNNGSVKVEFYPEKRFPQPLNWNGITTLPYTQPSWTTNPYDVMYTTNNANISGTAGVAFYSTSTSNNVGASINAHVSSEIETGRIEKGSKSYQNFGTTNDTFEWYTCAISEWKILPDSHKPIEIKEIRNYCSGCGTRIKKQTWKFCPNCGDKF